MSSSGHRTNTLFILICLTVAYAQVVEIQHLHKGRAYGSSKSSDIAHRIAIAPDGAIFIAGTTTPHNADEDPWGDTEAGDLTGGVDVFIAKLSPAGELLWVRRVGSSRNDALGDLQAVGDAVYICGTTAGDLGRSVNGSADAFVHKLSSEGDMMWTRALQFGSAGIDSCNGLAVWGRRLYAVGSTSGVMFGDVEGEGKRHTSDHFIALFKEGGEAEAGVDQFSSSSMSSSSSLSSSSFSSSSTAVLSSSSTSKASSTLGSSSSPLAGTASVINEDEEELQLQPPPQVIRGRQRGAYGNSSANCVAVTADSVFVLSTSWDDRAGGSERLTTYLYVVDRDTLMSHRMFPVLTDEAESFHGTGMVVSNNSAHVYIVGVAALENNTSAYYALCLHSSAEQEGGFVEWSAVLGMQSTTAPIERQQPVVALDEGAGMVCVGGTEEGWYESEDGRSGVLLTPLFRLNATTGEVVEKWQRSTGTADGKQEMLDMGMDVDGNVMLTGVWEMGGVGVASAWVASVGSGVFESQTDGAEPVWSSAEMRRTDETGTVVMERGRRSGVTGFVILGGVLVGLVMTGCLLCADGLWVGWRRRPGEVPDGGGWEGELALSIDDSE